MSNNIKLSKLAEVIINHSIELKPSENVLIEVRGDGEELVIELIRKIYEVGGLPFIKYLNYKVNREWLKGISEKQASLSAKWEEFIWKDVQAKIIIDGSQNEYEYQDIPLGKMNILHDAMAPVNDFVYSKLKWVGLHYPNASMAQKASMSTESFENFYFNVCTLNYKKMYEAMVPLRELMERTDRVRIIGTGTDLNFSIKAMPKVICAGQYNLPDGEIFTAPVKESVNGKITYNTPSVYMGKQFENIQLTFESGKIIHASSNDSDRLNEILDSDEGARYIGEFAIGVNPLILHPMNNTLFDEKIAGSFHLTPGDAYSFADNGNRSLIHWDLVCIQRPEYGGGEIWFDDVLIRKDGRFVIPELELLNPENLK